MTQCALILSIFLGALAFITVSVFLGPILSSWISDLYWYLETKRISFFRLTLPKFNRIPQWGYTTAIAGIFVLMYYIFIPWNDIKPCDPVKKVQALINPSNKDCGCEPTVPDNPWKKVAELSYDKLNSK